MRKRDFFILSTNTAVTRTSVFVSVLAAVAAAQCNGHASAGSHEGGNRTIGIKLRESRLPLTKCQNKQLKVEVLLYPPSVTLDLAQSGDAESSPELFRT